VARVAGLLGFSRQYYYKYRKEKEQRLVIEKNVLSLVHKERKILTRLGGKKLYHQIKPALAVNEIKFGRDKLFKLLAERKLLIKPKRTYTQTTMSKHWLRKYPNLIKGVVVDAPEQVWVSDITYIKSDEGNCFLNMVTDVFSRKIMGYAIAANMDTGSMIKAYEMALKNRKTNKHQLIHHSDRGLQYCSQEYVKLSAQNDIKISMTENGDPYENALAERMNRTMKEEFGLGRLLPSRQKAFRLAQEAVEIYNSYRPHLALKMKTPNEVHLQKIPATEATGT
jgi:transposase InsO family protein